MNIQLRKLIRETIEYIGQINQPEYYLDDFYAIDYNSDVDESSAIQFIQSIINQVNNFTFPLIVYRGINTKSPNERGYENSSWSLDKKVAQGFGDKLLIGIIPNKNIIDLEQTIRTRVMNPGENEIYVPNSEGVIIQ